MRGGAGPPSAVMIDLLVNLREMVFQTCQRCLAGG